MSLEQKGGADSRYSTWSDGEFTNFVDIHGLVLPTSVLAKILTIPTVPVSYEMIPANTGPHSQLFLLKMKYCTSTTLLMSAEIGQV